MPDASSFYLGPAKPRLLARTWDDIVAAAAAGVLDETHWAELKQDVPASSKSANKELAKDLASLSVDGGVLVIGIQDDHGMAGEVVGSDLRGMADRFAQVASGSISPALSIATTPIPHPTEPDRGVLLVTVPASLGAPHMVEGLYWGRGDKGKRRLSDDEVRRLLATLISRAEGFESRLRALSEDLDPTPEDDRQHGHLYLLLEPSAPVLDQPLTLALQGQQFLQLTGDALSFRPQGRPSLDGLQWTLPHPNGILGHFHDPQQPVKNENRTLSALLLDDGTLQVTSGAGTIPYGRDADGEEVVNSMLVLETVHAAVELAGHVADRYLGYQGPWRAGIWITSLKGRRSSTARLPRLYEGHQFPSKEYLRIIEATTSMMREAPSSVVEQLIRPLLRTFGEADMYLPYSSVHEVAARLQGRPGVH